MGVGSMPDDFLRPGRIRHHISTVKGVYWNVCIELASITREYRVPIVKKHLALEVHNGEAESLGFPHNCGEILQVRRQESSEGGQQSRSPGLLEALEVGSDVPSHRCVQSNQVQNGPLVIGT